MLLKLFVFAICEVIEITKSHYLPSVINTKYAVARNREDLINIIKSLKINQNGLNNIEESDSDLNDEEKEKKLQNVIWLLKKNYNAQKKLGLLQKNRYHTTARLYFLKNPEVLEEYKNHLNKIRRFSNSKENIGQQINLKTKLRNRRRDAIFRLASSELDSEDIDKKDESESKVIKGRQLHFNNPIETIQEKEKIQVLRKDMIDEYPELKDTLESHNTNIHNTLRSDYDLRREKNKWEQKQQNLDSVETIKKKKKVYKAEPSHKENRFDVETVNWDKITTKDNPMKYKKKKILKEPEYKIKSKESDYKIKSNYNRPKNEYVKKDYHSYGRTSIPFVGKRGIYDEK